MFTLVRLTGPRKNEKLRLEQTRVRLGRAKGNHVRFDRVRERVVSNYHAEIRSEDGGYVLYDLQSTHGTYVNNERISRRRLQEGDIVGLALQMGGPTLRFSQRSTESLSARQVAQYEQSSVTSSPEPTSAHLGEPATATPGKDEPGVPHDDPGKERSLGGLEPEGSSASPEAGGLESGLEHGAGCEPEIPTSWTPSPQSDDLTSALPSSLEHRSSTGADPLAVPEIAVTPDPVEEPSAPGAAGTSDLSEAPGDATSFMPAPPSPATPSRAATPLEKVRQTGKHTFQVVKMRLAPVLARLNRPKTGDQSPQPGALLDPNAGTISLGTRIRSTTARMAGGAGRAWRWLRTRKPRKKPAPPPIDPGKEVVRTRRKKKRNKAARQAPAPVGPAPRYPKPFVLEEAIKEPPRPDWVWMQRHRWLLRFILVAIAASWWYQDRIFNWFDQFSSDPVPMIRAQSPEEGLAGIPGAQNTEFVELTRELYEATQARKPLERSDGNRELRALRPVLWKAGEESALVPVDFLEDVSEAIDRVREQRDFHIVYLRSLRYRPKIVQMLREAHLPEIMSFIPWLESNYLPSYRDSETGKVGLWGLDPVTARRHGLVVTAERDDRLDWKRSTQAACSYLVELVGEIRGLSFTLAAAAYPQGPLAIRRMLRQRDAWKKDEINLWYFYREDYIPSKMFDYLTRLLAVASISETPEAYHMPPVEDE